MPGEDRDMHIERDRDRERKDDRILDDGNDKYFTDLDGRFSARLSHVLAARRTEAPSETTGITAKYHCIVKVEYQRDLMGLLEEGMLLAVRNFRSNESESRYTLLEISRIFPEHYGLKGLSDDSYYPYQFEIIQQAVGDWHTDDRATMMIQLDAIPLNYDLVIPKDSEARYEKGFSYPVIAERVRILNRNTIHQMYNRPVLERMGLPWEWIATSPVARKDPRLGVVKMFESEKERIPIYVDYERLVRYHFGIFGFTGCGKSNLLSNILRRLIYHTPATKVVIFDISAEYPFLLQDVLADPSIPSKLILETPIESPEQLHRIAVKPRAFEKDARSKDAFAKILSQGKVGFYIEPESAIPTYEEVLYDLRKMREDNVGKPTYTDALDYVRLAIRRYMRAKGIEATDLIDEAFVDFLDNVARQAVEKFRVFERSNVHGWCTTRNELRDRFAMAAEEGKIRGSIYSTQRIVELLEGDTRLVLLSIVEPSIIKRLAIDLTARMLAQRKREFQVEPPILFAFDEAQEFVPAYDRARGIERECTERVETLLRQGRKYGLGCCIATQRIAYLNTNALQQLHTYFVGPLPRPYDRTLVSSTFTIDQGILEKTLEFGPGEWLLSSYVATGMENVPIFIKADDAEREIEAFLTRA
ncbi:MAG: ATP-binding protein [Candidatus Bathyarchaeia archaeon]